MPRRGSNEITDEDEAGGDRSRKNPRRGGKAVSYKEDNADGEDPMDVESEAEEENAETSDDDEEMEDAGADADDDDDEEVGKRSRSRAGRGKKKAVKAKKEADKERRTSSRATKFKSSMKEPTDKSILDLMKVPATTNNKNDNKKAKKARRKASSDDSDSDSSSDDTDTEEVIKTPKKTKRQNNKRTGGAAKGKPKLESPVHKSPARRHKQTRLTIKTHTTQPNQSDDESTSAESDVEDDDDEEEDEEEPFKIERIIASRTEPKKKWAEICKKMNTTEIENGSRWVQESASPVDDDDDSFEERFLVKWKDYSYLHVSWETQNDLVEFVEGAKGYLRTFFRKSKNGYLFDADERNDGEFFDPMWTQIDRIVEVQYPETCPCKNVKDEDKVTNEQLGIVLDKNDPEFKDGLGREFLVKWGNQAYSEGAYEFERDLILNEVEYKDQLKQFLSRKKKPTKEKAKKLQKEGEAEFRRLYKSLFGAKSDARQEDAVEEYQRKLQEHVYKNGGQLRDYQAVGVSWLMANLVNRRSCILADEMGLGKTLQTAAFINLIATQLNRRGPFLIVVPLSTLAHWQREFQGWTDLNTIVYHGSAKDRDLIRELEFAREADRPQGAIGLNQLYLRKCKPKRSNPSIGNHWMVEVVVTTPELLTADDWVELTAVKWECLVVDEAQKLKNFNSKLATNLRDARFEFNHKLLLTGTPIQNNMEELFALLNFIDPELFPDCDDFVAKYGDMKSKEKVDQLHDEIRPYMLRRLKEDAEKSVPPKEETVIEVELTVAQKQYYRALYEKNVKFLHKDKRKALDGPSLNNLAMQLRKCCNHLFLLNGIEETFRASQKKEGHSLSEGDLLVKASGKLVLLDKLLPRLKEKGHRILVFSQFSRTLDLLEDYLIQRVFKFERIDGSITGKKRQQAIDRFQAPTVEGKEQPFIMLLTTRAGGVGINLTAADTCIIFDSDWNPQNDLQAQARCHRIGQTKNVQVFRLLTRNTYEMVMFGMSSKKMGLDQAVLSGVQAGDSGLTKDEVEMLLKHGAYGAFTEEKDGAEESNAFVQQDIDTILERRSRKVVHDNTGSNSGAAGGTFSKARFAGPSGGEGKKGTKEDVDINDPDFWRKMVGEGKDDTETDDLTGKRRKRTVTNYSEGAYEKKVEQSLLTSDVDVDDDDEDESEDDESYGSGDEGEKRERFRWGGTKRSQWKVEEAKKLVNVLLAHGYGTIPWSRFVQEVGSTNGHSEDEVRRMCWSILLVAICEMAEDDASTIQRRAVRAAEKKRDADNEGSPTIQGGVLADSKHAATSKETEALIQKCFDKQWNSSASWAARAMKDALQFAKNGVPRSEETLSSVLRTASGSSAAPLKQDDITTKFVQTVWPSLKNRGWKAEVIAEGPFSGKTQYSYEGKQYYSPEAVIDVAGKIHVELANMVQSLQSAAESSRQKSKESEAKLREKHLAMNTGTINVKDLLEFLSKYTPLQLLYDRKHHKKLSLTARKLLHACNYMHTATTLVKAAGATKGTMPLIDQLSSILIVDKRLSLPHPLWSPRHDAVLIHAIAKHGWIENDSSCRRLINDSEITWGFPFDSDASNAGGGNKTSQKADLINSLRETASRAADLLNDHDDILREVKGFDNGTVVRTYNLVQEARDDNEGEETPNDKPKWEVDEEALLESTGLDTNESQEAELPPKKELAKRIKSVLSKNVGNVGTRANNSPTSAPRIMQVDSKGEQEFCVIDQSDRCNILLAEILIAIIKAKPQNAMKFLCSVAIEEATKRKASILARTDSTDQSKNSKRAKAAEEMTEVIKNIALAKKFSKQSRQARNVLRAMIGLDVVKHTKDPTFPVEGPLGEMGSLQKLSGQRQAANGPKSKKEESACGDKALTRAIAKCYDKNNGGPGRVSPEGHVSDLELTAIETLIISVVCSQGLPVWTEDMSSLLVVETNGENQSKSSLTLSWIGLGSILSTAAKDWHDTASRKVEACQLEWDKHQDKPDESQTKSRARKNLANAIRIAEIKETAAAQAAEYAEDPSILAQKTVMLIERLRRRMGNPAGGHTKTAKKVNLWLGPFVFDFLSNQLSKWANALDIVDGKGDTLSYTAADFYHDLPDEERGHVEVAATLNKQDCRLLLIQITSVLRLRSLFMKYSKDDLLEKIDRAAKATKTGDSWETQPPWWRLADNPSHHDALLIESIVEYGFCGVLENARGFGPPDKTDEKVSLKDLGLTKVIIQQRVNQLARELHNIERNVNATRVIEELRRKENAAEKNKGTGKSSKGGKKQTQTALHSFFAKTAGSSKRGGSVVVLSDIEDDNASKQQKSDTIHVVEIDLSPRPTKENEGNAQATVSGEKRRSASGRQEPPASPEKKLRSS